MDDIYHGSPGSRRLSDGSLFADMVDLNRREVSLRVYDDQEVFALEMEHLFAKSWIPVAHESEIPNPGDFVRRYIGRDSCLVVRKDDGGVSILLNACTHRGMSLCREEKGRGARFKCPYHGWVFSKEGALLAAPYEKLVYENHLREDMQHFHLTTAKVATLGGLVFGNWDHDAEPFDAYLGDIGWYLKAVLERSDRGLEVLGPPQRHIMRANWKLLAEQLADGYHAPTLHRSQSDLGLMGVENTPESWGVTGINVSTPGGHQLRCVDFRLLYEMGGGSANDPVVERLAMMPPPGSEAELTRQFSRHLTEGQLKLLADTPPVVMGLFPGADFFCFFFEDGEGGKDMGPVMVARAWIPRAPDLFEMVSWVLVERDASDRLRDITRRTSVRQFGISGMIEQDDAEAWSGVQQVASGPMGRKLRSKYGAVLGKVRPDDFDGPGDVHAGVSRDDAQWAWWRRYFEVMSSQAG